MRGPTNNRGLGLAVAGFHLAHEGIVETTSNEQQQTTIVFDVVVEVAILAAAILSIDARRKLCRIFPTPESFLHPMHRAIWSIVIDLERRGLSYDPAIVHRLGGGTVDLKYVATILENRPEAPAPAELDHFIDTHRLDLKRASIAVGPLAAFVDGVRDPRTAMAKLQALHRQIGAMLEGAGGSYLIEGKRNNVEIIDEIRAAAAGGAHFPYGCRYLDQRADGSTRTFPGAAPGHITLVTGVSGGGKSILAIHMLAGLAIAQKRKVLAFMPEMEPKPVKKILAAIVLGIPRTDVFRGTDDLGNPLSEETLAKIASVLHKLDRQIVFMGNPFGRGGKGETNEGNLDIVQSHIEESNADVFIADLWDRICLDDRPWAEKRALLRTQDMAKELRRVHFVLVAQEKLKEVEKAEDPRPTRAGIKGNSAWVDVADRIFAIHSPSQYKEVPDTSREVTCLKDRHNTAWPWAVDVAYSKETGRLGPHFNEIAYIRPGTAAPADDWMDRPKAPKRRR